jgi:integrase
MKVPKPLDKGCVPGFTFCFRPDRDADGAPVPSALGWKYLLRAPGGKPSKTIFAADKADAVSEAHKQVARWAAEAGAGAKPAERTMDALSDHFLAVKRHADSPTRVATADAYARELEIHIRPFFGKTTVAGVTPNDVDRWRAEHASSGKSRTRQKRVSLLSSLFRLAVDEGWRVGSPVLTRHHVPVLKHGKQKGKLVGDQRVARVLNAEQLAAAVERLDPDDLALRLLVELTGRVGLRLREATHLRAGDWAPHPDGSAFVTVGSSFACACRECCGLRLTKAGKARLVPVPQDLIAPLAAHAAALTARFGPGGWLFPVWHAKPRQRTRPGDLRVARTTSEAFITAAGDGYVFHDLRATAKTHLRLGGNHDAVDAAMGHELPGMSSVYVQFQEQPALLYKGVYPDWRPTLTMVKAAVA